MFELPMWLRVRRRILYLKIVARYRRAKLRLLEVLLWTLKPLELLGRALGVEDGIRLKPSQRTFLIEAWCLELETAVEEAERHAISDQEAGRISLVRSLIRWLEHGDLPEPGSIPFLEDQLTSINRLAPPLEATERRALVVAIGELGGNARLAAQIQSRPDPDFLRGFGWTLHRNMRLAGLTVAELAERSRLEPSQVVAFLYGTESPRLKELLHLAGAVDATLDALVAPARDVAEVGFDRRPGREAGLNRPPPADDDPEVRP